jgi:hypothetical protein
MFRTQSTPEFYVAEHYGLRNTTCFFSKDVASGNRFYIATENTNGNANAWLGSKDMQAERIMQELQKFFRVLVEKKLVKNW